MQRHLARDLAVKVVHLAGDSGDPRTGNAE